MKKILVIRNVLSASIHSIAFAIKITKEIPGKLHGIFFNENSEPGLQYPFPNDMTLAEVSLTEEAMKEENMELLNSHIKLFEDECSAAGVSCKVSTALTLDELLELSSSSDLIIAEMNTDFSHFSLKDILTSAHCPVFVAGTNAVVIEKVILTFDGNETSKYAVKKYKELFPHFSHLPTLLITINLSPLEILEHKEYIYNLLPGYFPNLTVKELKGGEKEELRGLLKLYGSDTLIVMGAFDRSAVSRLFHPSLANIVLNEARISLFNAHE